MANENVVLEIDPTNITTVSEEQKPRKKNFTYENPYWSNKDAKHMIVTLLYEDGRRSTASIQDKDGTNPDYQAILEEFGEEVLDKNTEEGVKRRDEQVKKRLERKETEAVRARQEQLFGAKLEAFEITAVKESKNTRKSLHTIVFRRGRVKNHRILDTLDSGPRRRCKNTTFILYGLCFYTCVGGFYTYPFVFQNH